MRPDLCAVDNAVDPENYLGRFWVDSLTHDPDALRFVMKLLGEEKVALGTDYPFPLGEDQPGVLIESMADLTQTTRERLLFRNACDWLGRTPEQLGLGLTVTHDLSNSR
jgi:aminocarboxymuconate-semialdehyde decarboxylase